jgi:putative bacteriocin precursor
VVLNVKKLNKSYNSMDNSVEAYRCGCGCACGCNCQTGCGGSSYVSYVADSGTKPTAGPSPGQSTYYDGVESVI